MPITRNCLVTLDYRLLSPGQEELYAENDLMYVHGGYQQLFAKVESALEEKEIGDTIRVSLSPSDAFGEYDETLRIEEALDDLPEAIDVGTEIDGYSEEDPDDVIIYTVMAIHDGTAVLDGNHPLAGQTVIFETTVKAVEALGDDAVRQILEHKEHHHDHG